MSSQRPYLTLDQRADYLVRHGYVDDRDLSEAVLSFLRHTNFHYFLGYARNFRKLRREGLVDGDDRIDRVVSMVELDREFSARLFAGIRILEWHLRAATVGAHCELFSPSACYLEPDHYVVMDPDARSVDSLIRDQIVRSREPYVLSVFEQFETRNGRPWRDSPLKMSQSDVDTAMRSLPIWAVIDGWSFGTLERFITESGPRILGDEQRWLRRKVAAEFEVSNQIFSTQLRGLVVLRNLIAHHSRLWMRPTASSPKSPKVYAKMARDSDPKSMWVASLTLASFLRASGSASSLVDDLETLLERDPLFAMGMKRPIASAS